MWNTFPKNEGLGAKISICRSICCNPCLRIIECTSMNSSRSGCSAMLVEVTSIHSHSIFKMVVYGSYFAWIFDDFDAFLFCFLILTLAFIPTPLAFRDFACFCKKSRYFCQRLDSSKRSADVGTRHARVTRRTSLH